MLKNYLTVALRNLWRNKIYTIINVLGLGIGLATMVWAYQNYRWSFSFDNGHENTEDVFRVLISREGSEIKRGIVPLPLAENAAQDFSSITDYVRLISRWQAVKHAKEDPISGRVHYVDPSFFSFFDFPLVAGESDLTDKSGVLLTTDMAEKYFGIKESYETILGKTLIVNGGLPDQKSYQVKGVLENAPMNSCIWFNFITNIDNLANNVGEPTDKNDWGNFIDAVFFRINEPTDADRIAGDLDKYIGPQNKAREDWKITGFELEHLSQVANHDNDLYSNYLNTRPPDSATFGPMVLALLIFLVCCLNFTNTTVARSNRRLKEMGVRKVMGGTQRQLVWQMMMECGFIVVLAVFLSVAINRYWLPAYNKMWTYLDINANYFSDPPLLAFMTGLVLLATFLAGSYPAFYISRFNPTNIFRGAVKFGGSNLFSRMLLGLQVVISLITVIAGVGFSRNSEFQKSYDYGYLMENIIISYTQDEESFTAFKNEVDRLPGVNQTAGTRHHLGFSYRMVAMESEGERKETGYMEVGENYLEVMGLDVIKGRGFDPKMPSDFENSIVINENLATYYGWDKNEVIGKRIKIDSLQFSVIGLLKDFHIDDLYSPLEPVAIKMSKPDRFVRLIVNCEPGKESSVKDQMKASWAKLFPFKPFDANFQNELKADALLTTDNIAWIFFWFAIISVLLTAIGLFALVSQTVLKKMKEIAVRKVVGASPRHIVALVNKGYVWIFLIAAIIGCYGGWFLTSFLMDMIFQVNVGIGANILTFSTLVVFLIAILTVGIKVNHALRTNPAEVLKGD